MENANDSNSQANPENLTTRARALRPDFVVAVLAVVIGVCTMIVYIVQARIMSRQLHATVWPYLETNFSYSIDPDPGVAVTTANKGVGPALVKKAFLILDDRRYPDSKAALDSLASRLTGSKNVLDGYTNLNTRVISPGEEIRFIEVTDSAKAVALMHALNGHRVRVEICYCSVFGDCWKTDAGKVTPCNSCD